MAPVPSLVTVVLTAMLTVGLAAGSEYDYTYGDMNFHYDYGDNSVAVAISPGSGQHYEPTWDSLDSRPLPAWYDEAKIGIFVHWGVFSVPSFGSEWFWYYWKGYKKLDYELFMAKNYRPDFTYAEFASQFTAEFFDPEDWADIFNSSGAKYIVLTSKHHEGYTNWPSKQSFSWNSMDVGPKRDLVGELSTAIRNKTDIKFGLYHSLYEWFNPLYLQDKANHWNTTDFVTSKTMPELYDIVEKYQPELIWSDGDWEAGYQYWRSTEFIAWLFNTSPVKDTVVVNDRWGIGTMCKHGSYYTCSDRYNPGTLQPHKWENAMTLDSKSWGYRRNAKLDEYLTIHHLLEEVVTTVSCGGNILVNVGPTKEGTIPTLMEERLRQMGQWLGMNGEAIYGSKPWGVQNDTLTPGVWYTAKEDVVYASVLTWPDNSTLRMASVAAGANTTATLLGDPSHRKLPVSSAGGVTSVGLPPQSSLAANAKWVYVVRLTGVAALNPGEQQSFMSPPRTDEGHKMSLLIPR